MTKSNTTTISDTSRERLTQMIRVLNTVDPKGFDLDSWFGTPEIMDAKMVTLLRANESFKVNPTECGTTACACGYAALDPWFISQGFKLDEARVHRGVDLIYQTESLSWINWSAVMNFFELSSRDADRLFMQAYYKYTPSEQLISEVIRRINFYLDGGDLGIAFLESAQTVPLVTMQQSSDTITP